MATLVPCPLDTTVSVEMAIEHSEVAHGGGRRGPSGHSFMLSGISSGSNKETTMGGWLKD